MTKPATTQRRAKPKKAGPPPPDVDEGLTLFDERGEFVHVASPQVAGSLRYVLARTRLVDGGELPERFGLTSTISGEGVTYLCRSLALVVAHDAARQVCIVDLNWWSPSTWPGHNESTLGIADVLRGNAELDEVIVPTGNPGLYLLPAGTTKVAERPVLANRPELDKLLVDLSERFDHVLLDLPAINATSEALTLAEAVGTVALVVCEGVTPETQIKHAIEELASVRVLGVVLNRSASRVPRIIRRRIPGA
jgi:Mrp family chromosome partitioning ATPase